MSSKHIKNTSKHIKTNQNTSKHIKNTSKHIKTHQKHVKTRQNTSKTHQNTSKHIKNTSKHIKTHQNTSKPNCLAEKKKMRSWDFALKKKWDLSKKSNVQENPFFRHDSDAPRTNRHSMWKLSLSSKRWTKNFFAKSPIFGFSTFPKCVGDSKFLCVFGPPPLQKLTKRSTIAQQSFWTQYGTPWETVNPGKLAEYS